MRTAILDLGTNTFNLLVADTTGDQTEFILSDKIPVKLGAQGFKDKRISAEAFDRGINAIRMMMTEAQQSGATQMYAYATSAIREASNAQEFINAVRDSFSLDIEVISGKKEAELIMLGVRSAGVIHEEKSLIIDIGGGSTEFIIADQENTYWLDSLNLGAARLLERFHPEDPITAAIKEKIIAYFEAELEPLFRELKKLKVSHLIGSSGSFDSIVDMILADAGKSYPSEEISNPILQKDMDRILKEMVASSMNDRQNRNGLISMRVDFIVMSSLLLQAIFKNHQFQQIHQCAYALKEGALFSTINDLS